MKNSLPLIWSIIIWSIIIHRILLKIKVKLCNLLIFEIFPFISRISITSTNINSVTQISRIFRSNNFIKTHLIERRDKKSKINGPTSRFWRRSKRSRDYQWWKIRFGCDIVFFFGKLVNSRCKTEIHTLCEPYGLS